MEKNQVNQTESWIVEMPANVIQDLYLSSRTDMSSICPELIKTHNVMKGEKGEEGSTETVEYCDGSIVEWENTKIDKKKMKSVYTETKNTKPCYKDCGKTTHIFRLHPVTYCGCPFRQAILDKVAMKTEDCQVCSEKTMIVWKTKFEKACDPSQVEIIREDKINEINDWLKDIAGQMTNLKCVANKEMFEKFVKLKLEKKVHEEDKCKAGKGYNYSMAKQDAERWADFE